MSSSTETSLRRTPLYERHVAAGARLVPYAGWEMPVQYTGIRDEHLAVRGDVGMFDVSHMGQVETRGPQARAFLQRMLSNDVRRISEGGAQYSVMCREDGGVLDDLFTYRLADSVFLTITNAANHEKDLAWLQAHAAEFDVDVIDRHADFAMLAVQGPRARDTGPRASPTARCRSGCTAASARSRALATLVCGTGYTGEDGVELLLDPADAPARLGRPDDRRRRDTDRARRARHAAPRGLLSPVRQRSERGARPDRGRTRLVLQGADRLHRLGGHSGRARGGAEGEARRRSSSKAAGSRGRATR